MTVITQTTMLSHAANGVAVIFSFDFRILDESHLNVYVDDVLSDPSSYIVTGVGDQLGGNVDFTPSGPPVSGSIVNLVRSVPLTQLVDYEPNDPFPADTHESALDKLTMIDQEQQEQLDRAILFEQSGGNYSFKFTEPVNDDLLAFDASGNYIINIEKAEDKAYRWAETDEDVIVEFRDGRNRYSAYHWSVKAFNATELPLENRGDIMVGDGNASPATILPVGPNGAFLRSVVDSDPGVEPTGLKWDEVPQALPPTTTGDKLKILQVKPSEDGFELRIDYANTLLHAKEWLDDDESDGDISAYTASHYNQVARRFETPAGSPRTAHINGAPITNHDTVGYTLTLTGSVGMGEAGSGTNVRLGVTPYLYWPRSGYAPSGTELELELPITVDDTVGTDFAFVNLIPANAGDPTDVMASLKIRRLDAVTDEYQGTFNITIGALSYV